MQRIRHVFFCNIFSLRFQHSHKRGVLAKYVPMLEILLDTLKAVLNDANIIFTENGLKLASVDSNKHALVHLFMEASSFEFFHCKQKLVLGIAIEIFHRTIKTNKLNGMMCFIVRRDNPGYLEVSFENYLKGTRVSDTIELLSLKEYNIKDKIEYRIQPEMDSQSFQNICPEMASFQQISQKSRA